MAIKVAIEDKEVVETLKDIYFKTKNLKPAMHLISLIVKKSIIDNFSAGGRPIAWKPSQRVLKYGGKTLIDTGNLRASFEVRADETSATVYTNTAYAAIHNFGGEIKIKAKVQPIFFKKYKKGKVRFSKESKATFGKKVNFGAYTITMPRREFMLVQEEDWPEIRNQLSEYILRLE